MNTPSTFDNAHSNRNERIMDRRSIFGSLKATGVSCRSPRGLLLLATLALAVITLAALASPQGPDGYWYDQWPGSTYHCQFTGPSGHYDGELMISQVSPDRYDRNCCSWSGTFSVGGQSYSCEGYARQGHTCYFKVEGGDNWCFLGSLSGNLKQMQGYYCDFERCYMSSWYGAYYHDSGYNDGGDTNSGYGHR
jgi:hypothetical protein